MSAQGVTITQIYSSPGPTTVEPSLYTVVVGQPYRVVTYQEGSVGFIGQGNLASPIAGDVALPYLDASDNTPSNLYAKIISGVDTWYSSDSDFAIAMSGSTIYINSVSKWIANTWNGNSVNLFKVYSVASPSYTSRNEARADITDNSACKVGDIIMWSARTYKAKITQILSNGTDVKLSDSSHNLGTSATVNNIEVFRNIAGAELLVRYKAAIDGLDGEFTVSEIDDLYDRFGPGYIYPESKLGYGTYKAYSAAGVKVKGWATQGETAANYTEAFDDIKKKKSNYFIVPLTFDAVVQSNLKSLVDTYAAPAKKHEMRAYISKKVGILFNTQNVGSSATKTFSVPSAVATDLSVGNKVILYNGYGARPAGTKTTEVTGIDGTTVTIGTTINGYGALTIVPTNIDLEVADAETIAKVYNDKRITLIGPGYFNDGNYTVEGYFAAAAYAGWRSGEVVHYSATFEPIIGFDGIPRAYYFDDDQLRTLSDAGWLMFVQDTPSSMPYCLRQMTTAYSVLETAEESLVISFDDLAKWLRTNLEPYLSRGIDNRISQNASDPVTKRYLQKIGSIVDIAKTKYVNDSEIFASIAVKALKPNPSIKDRTDLVLEVRFYYPNNTIHVELVQI